LQHRSTEAAASRVACTGVRRQQPPEWPVLSHVDCFSQQRLHLIFQENNFPLVDFKHFSTNFFSAILGNKVQKLPVVNISISPAASNHGAITSLQEVWSSGILCYQSDILELNAWSSPWSNDEWVLTVSDRCWKRISSSLFRDQDIYSTSTAALMRYTNPRLDMTCFYF